MEPKLKSFQANLGWILVCFLLCAISIHYGYHKANDSDPYKTYAVKAITGALSCEYLEVENFQPRQDSFACYCSEDKREITKVLLSWEGVTLTSDKTCEK